MGTRKLNDFIKNIYKVGIPMTWIMAPQENNDDIIICTFMHGPRNW